MYTLNKDVKLSQFRINEGKFPDRLRSARQQYQNMFEIPILFYLLCLLNIFFNHYTQFDIVLAWGFVFFRVLHFFIRVQNQISDIASRVTEQASRSTASFSAGISTNNPKNGSNFLGFKSSAVDPAVAEFQNGLLLLEELQVLLVDKCSEDDLDWSDQPLPKG